MVYPATTLFTIIATGNHYWIDGVGGLIVLVLGFTLGGWIHRLNQARLDRKFAEHIAGHPASGT